MNPSNSISTHLISDVMMAKVAVKNQISKLVLSHSSIQFFFKLPFCKIRGLNLPAAES